MPRRDRRVGCSWAMLSIPGPGSGRHPVPFAFFRKSIRTPAII
ncbi:hypothetical protein ASZ90_000722 [hydrocarbon metagenome]|uniref:Uncharacterized protein n=1 Tax=hydrocarbon metagenome TaxID=938273 RepID=A0A0W8GA51_9ZZZZ